MDNIIYIQVDEEIRVASFRVIDHPVHLMAQVEFEDGYQNIFYTDVETGKWMEQDMGFTELAEETGMQLMPYMKYELDFYKDLNFSNLLHHSQLSFGYHKYNSGDYSIYEVYHSNRRYMFTAVKSRSGVWQIILFSGESNWSYPESYHDEVPYLVDICEL